MTTDPIPGNDMIPLSPVGMTGAKPAAPPAKAPEPTSEPAAKPASKKSTSRPSLATRAASATGFGLTKRQAAVAGGAFLSLAAGLYGMKMLWPAPKVVADNKTELNVEPASPTPQLVVPTVPPPAPAHLPIPPIGSHSDMLSIPLVPSTPPAADTKPAMIPPPESFRLSLPDAPPVPSHIPPAADVKPAPQVALSREPENVVPAVAVTIPKLEEPTILRTAATDTVPVPAVPTPPATPVPAIPTPPASLQVPPSRVEPVLPTPPLGAAPPISAGTPVAPTPPSLDVPPISPNIPTPPVAAPAIPKPDRVPESPMTVPGREVEPRTPTKPPAPVSPTVPPTAPLDFTVPEVKTMPEAGTRVSPPSEPMRFTKPSGSTDVRPVAASTERPARTDYDVGLHEARSGETYESISEEWYNSKKLAAALRAYNGNKALTGQGPVQVPPIDVLRKNYPQMSNGDNRSSSAPQAGTPEWTATSSARPVSAKEFVVPAGGMTMREAAKAALGRDTRWSELYELNPEITNPGGVLPAGTKLRLP